MRSVSRADVFTTVCAAGVAAALPSLVQAAAKIDGDDLKALASALALERAAIKAYGDVASANVLSPPVLAVFNRFLAEHTAHRDAIVAAISAAGQTPGSDVATQEALAPKTELDALGAVYGIERSLADAHFATVATFKNRDYTRSVASILGVETTHVALLAEALRKSPAYPGGFLTSPA